MSKEACTAAQAAFVAKLTDTKSQPKFPAVLEALRKAIPEWKFDNLSPVSLTEKIEYLERIEKGMKQSTVFKCPEELKESIRHFIQALKDFVQPLKASASSHVSPPPPKTSKPKVSSPLANPPITASTTSLQYS